MARKKTKEKARKNILTAFSSTAKGCPEFFAAWPSVNVVLIDDIVERWRT